MKKHAIFVFAILFALSLTVSAQEQTTPKDQKGSRREMRQGGDMQTAQQRTDRLAKELNLTSAEKAKVQVLFEKQDADRKKKQTEQQMEAKVNRKEMRAKMEADRKAQDEELKKIIGEEKFQKFQTIREERMKKMKDRMQNGQRGNRPQQSGQQ